MVTLREQLREALEERDQAYKDIGKMHQTLRDTKSAVRSMTERTMTFIMAQTPQNLYSVHQILRDVEALLGDLDFRR